MNNLIKPTLTPLLRQEKLGVVGYFSYVIHIDKQHAVYRELIKASADAELIKYFSKLPRIHKYLIKSGFREAILNCPLGLYIKDVTHIKISSHIAEILREPDLEIRVAMLRPLKRG